MPVDVVGDVEVVGVCVVVVVAADTVTAISRLVPTIPDLPAVHARTVHEPTARGVSVNDAVTWSDAGLRSEP